MGIWDRVKFIGRSYLNSLLDEVRAGRSSPPPARDPDAGDADGDDFHFDEDAFEREWEEFRRRNASRPGSGTRASAQDPSIEQCYQRLEVPVGSDLTAVRSAFRRLMKIYHPDRHGADPKRQADATKVAQALSQAYEILEANLSRRKT